LTREQGCRGPAFASLGIKELLGIQELKDPKGEDWWMVDGFGENYEFRKIQFHF